MMQNLCTLSVFSTSRILKSTSRTHRELHNHIAVNSRRNTVPQPSNGSNTSQCTDSSHLCLASSTVGGGGANREGRPNFGIGGLSAACVLCVRVEWGGVFKITRSDSTHVRRKEKKKKKKK